MFNLLSTLICAALLNTTPATSPAAPAKTLSFGASAYVTVSNQIKLAIEKSKEQPVSVILRNSKNEVLFQQVVTKRSTNYSARLDVSQLTDGQYELEFKSSEGSIRKQLNVATSQPQAQPARVIVMK